MFPGAVSAALPNGDSLLVYAARTLKSAMQAWTQEGHPLRYGPRHKSPAPYHSANSIQLLSTARQHKRQSMHSHSGHAFDTAKPSQCLSNCGGILEESPQPWDWCVVFRRPPRRPPQPQPTLLRALPFALRPPYSPATTAACCKHPAQDQKLQCCIASLLLLTMPVLPSAKHQHFPYIASPVRAQPI